jgi:hypothetical protein
MQTGFDLAKCFLAFQRLKLPISVGLKPVARFEQPSLVKGRLFGWIKTTPEQVNDLSSLPSRKSERFVCQKHAIHGGKLT